MIWIDRINAAAIACLERGKTPKRAHVGLRAMVEILDWLETAAHWVGGTATDPIKRLTINTASGPIDIAHRPTLDEYVIVYSQDDEPFIHGPHDDLEAA